MNRLASIALLLGSAACRTTTTPAAPEAAEAAPTVAATPPDEPSRASEVAARLRRAGVEASVAGGSAAAARSIVVCEGESWSEAHLPRPSDRLHAVLRRTFVADDTAGTIEMHESAQVGEEVWTTRARLHDDDIVVASGDTATPLSSAEQASWRLALRSPFPARLTAHLLAGATDTGLEGDHVWGIGRATGTWDAWIGPPSAPLTLRVDAHDPLWGDIDERYAWSRPAADAEGSTIVTRMRHGEVVERLRCRAADEVPPELAATELAEPPPADPPTPAQVEVAELAPDVFALELVHLDHRSIVVVQDDGLLVVEAPVDAAAGERLLGTMAERWPDRPVRHLVVTHHHPDHAGAIRPFIARGIPIVTTAGNVGYFDRIAAADWSRAPDEQWRSPRRPAYEIVAGERSLGRVRIFDIGPRTTHTDEYLVVYVPAAQLLVHGDLAAARPDGEVRPAGPRTQGLAAAIRERKLDVQILVGTWPLHRAARTMSAAQLRRALELAASTTAR